MNGTCPFPPQTSLLDIKFSRLKELTTQSVVYALSSLIYYWKLDLPSASVLLHFVCGKPTQYIPCLLNPLFDKPLNISHGLVDWGWPRGPCTWSFINVIVCLHRLDILCLKPSMHCFINKMCQSLYKSPKAHIGTFFIDLTYWPCSHRTTCVRAILSKIPKQVLCRLYKN